MPETKNPVLNSIRKKTQGVNLLIYKFQMESYLHLKIVDKGEISYDFQDFTRNSKLNLQIISTSTLKITNLLP